MAISYSDFKRHPHLFRPEIARQLYEMLPKETTMKTPKEVKVHQGDDKYQYTHKGDNYVKEASKAHKQYEKGGKNGR